MRLGTVHPLLQKSQPFIVEKNSCLVDDKIQSYVQIKLCVTTPLCRTVCVCVLAPTRAHTCAVMERSGAKITR